MANPSKSAPLLQGFTSRWFILLFGVPLSYAVIRYHVCKGVAWEHFPLYILNKAVSLAAAFFIGVSYLIGKVIKVYSDDPEKRLILIKFCGLMRFSLAAIHAFMALLLFSMLAFAAALVQLLVKLIGNLGTKREAG